MKPVWLYDRWYDSEARERVRQLALWSAQPVLLYANTGLPLHGEEVATLEVAEFQREGVVELWQYEGEKRYAESVAPAGPARLVDASAYDRLTTFVEEKMERSYPAIDELGFRDAEGMLLEQVVLRRRFFTQAISRELGVSGLGTGRDHVHLYHLETPVEDALQRFFSQLNLPRLALMKSDDYLALRERAHRILPEVAAELTARLDDRAAPFLADEAVKALAAQYEKELVAVVRKLGERGTFGARASAAAFEEGRRTMLEAQLAMFRDAGDADGPSISDDDPGTRLVLFLLDWRTGRGGSSY